MSKLTILIFVFAILFFTGCKQQTPETYTVEIVDSVRHINNFVLLWDDEPKVALEFVQKVGEFESADENYMFHIPLDIDVDSRDNLFILDRGNYRIQKFNASGKYIRTIGRQGEGPGEFAIPVALNIRNDTLWVADNYAKKISMFNTDGKFIKSIRMKKGFMHFRLLNSGEIAADILTISSISFNGKEEMYLFGILNGEVTVIREFGKIDVYNIKYISQSVNTARVTEQDNMISFNIDSDDNIYAVYNKQNRIEKFSPDGELLWTADCNLNYKPPFTKNNRNLTKTPANRLVSWNINIDSKNRIWINTAVQYRQNRNIPSKKMFEIYDCDGILLTMLEHPRNFKTMRIIKNSLFLFDFSEESVYEYRTIEK